MALVRVLIGPERSERGRAIEDSLLGAVGRSVLLVPTHRYARARTERLLERSGLAGFWGEPITTFEDFLGRILRGTEHAGGRIDQVAARLLLEGVVARLAGEGGLGPDSRAFTTPGFVSHAQRIISRLKQAAITPESFESRLGERGQASGLDRIVAAVYRGYQEALRSAGVYDLQGMYWLADEACRVGKPAGIADVDVLLLDGFDDFTPSEFRLLETLAPRLESLVFGLSFDAAPARSDLYELPWRTFKRIHSRFEPVVDHFEEKPAETAAEFVSSHLFYRDAFPESRGLASNVRLWACHGARDELERVARSIKRLALDGSGALDGIAVVHRDFRGVRPLLEDVFSEYGIPARFVESPGAGASSVVGFVRQCLDAMGEWRRDAVLDVVCSPWFPHGAGDGLERLFAMAAREAGVISGYAEWRRLVLRFRGRFESGEGEELARLRKRFPGLGAACTALLGALKMLREAEGYLPATGTCRGYVEGVRRLMDRLGLEEAVGRCGLERVREVEAAGLELLSGVLGSLGRWSDERRLGRSEFAALLERCMASASVQLPRRADGVWCLDVESVRRLEFEHVFFIGLNEGVTPRPPDQNAIYSEADLDELRKIGIDLEGRWTHLNREALLFHHVFDAARRGITLSWHETGPDGRTRGPSPYIEDVRRALPHVEVERHGSGLDVVAPPLAGAMSWRDVGNRLFAVRSPARRRLGGRFAAATAGEAAESERQERGDFGVYDGVMKSEAIREELAARYGPGCVFSVTQLETYADCPFRFFLERLLDVEAPREADEGFDYRVRGTILHDALEAFHVRYRGKAISEIDQCEALEAMEDAADRAFERLAWRSTGVPEAVMEVERRRIGAALRRYVLIERERDEGHWKPSYFEAAFGPARGEARDPASVETPFVLDTGSGPVAFWGKLDRIDVDGTQARIVDYKTTLSADPKGIKEGRYFQLAVYSLALEGVLLAEKECSEAWYVRVGSEKRLEALNKAKEWEDRREAAVGAVGAAVAGIRAARFHPTTRKEPCSWCPNSKVCRYERGRVERKSSNSRPGRGGSRSGHGS